MRSDTAEEQKKRVRQREMPPIAKEPQLGEGWLVDNPGASVFNWLNSTSLNKPKVWLPTCALLLSMAVLHPLLVLQQLDPADNFYHLRKLPVQLHAAGTGFWWIGMVLLFFNLRDVVQPRSSWLESVARTLGAEEDEIEASRSQGRNDLTELIADKCQERSDSIAIGRSLLAADEEASLQASKAAAEAASERAMQADIAHYLADSDGGNEVRFNSILIRFQFNLIVIFVCRPWHPRCCGQKLRC